MRDVVTPHHRPVQGTRKGDLFTLDLESGAFEVGNDVLLVYGPPKEDESWLGDHRVISKAVFAAEALTNMMSLMIFGEPREAGIEKIHAFLKAGSPLQNVRCCFVCLRSIKALTTQWYNFPHGSRRRSFQPNPERIIESQAVKRFRIASISKTGFTCCSAKSNSPCRLM